MPLLFRGTSYRQLDTLSISGGGCKIRRVFTLKDISASIIDQNVRHASMYLHDDDVVLSGLICIEPLYLSYSAKPSPSPLPLSPQDGSGLILPRGLEFPPGLQVVSQLLGSTSLRALMTSPVGSGIVKAATVGNGNSASTSTRTSHGKPSLTVHIDADSSDEESSGRIRMLSGAAAGTPPPSGAPGSPWAAGRAPSGDQLPPMRRVSRPLLGSAIAAAAAVPTGAAGPSSTQFASGRRAISAQTVLREEAAGGSRPSQIQRSTSNATESSTASQRGPSAPSGSGRSRGGVTSGPTLIPVGPPAMGSGPMLAASPPYPKAVYSQRTQSGPARLCEDAVLSGAIDQQQPGTPTSAKHGRR